MPISIVPTKVNEPKDPAEPGSERETTAAGATPEGDSAPELESETGQSRPRAVRGSRWIDYDTHELLQMLGELEDERRWARLREGMLWAVLVHIMLLLALFLIPKYLLKMVPVVQTSSIRDHKDFTYLDTPNLPAPKPVRPLPNKPLIDKQTMEEMKRQAPPASTPAAPPPPQPAPEQAKTEPPPPIPPNQQSQSQIEAPKPPAVPAKPNFAVSAQNPADQLREDMQRSMENHGSQGAQVPGGAGPAGHPGAGTGAPDILSDTQGVDFSSWLARWHYVTQRTWDPLIPDEVNPPILKSGVVAIRFKVLPNGQVTDMQLDGRSGDTALDRAAWGAITGSSYPALPRDFHGPYLELRAYFLYNTEPR
jgi:TonB family protein